MHKSAIQLVNAATGNVFPAAPDDAVLRSSRIATSRGLIVEHQRLAAAEMPPHYVVHHRLLINLGPPIKLEWKQGKRWQSAYHDTGSFTLLTDGEFNAPRWSESLEAIAIALEPEFANSLIQTEHTCFEEVRGDRDSAVYDLACHFKNALIEKQTENSLYIDSLASAFTFHLLERYSMQKAALRKLGGRLDAHRLKHVIEFLNDNIDQSITLKHLAALVNFSPFHFARCFKATTGYSPHQFLLKLRIEKAQQLMMSRLNLTEVAVAAGFYDQSHFVHAFKRYTGLTPMRFMQQLLS